MNFWQALEIAVEHVADCVYQRPTVLQALTYIVSEVTPAELANLEPNVREAYQLVREHHEVH